MSSAPNSRGAGAPTIQEVLGAGDLAEVRTLFEEYAASLGIDLEFQQFARELGGLPGDYSPPSGGLWLAMVDDRVVGCVAVRRLEPGIAEMKRLHVRPAARGLGAGRALAQRAVAFARSAGYEAIRLDTLAPMTEAQALYRRMGFVDVPAYRFNPIEGATYLELRLDSGEAAECGRTI
jgi:ribosomal protein S18 acetylase RimI-like enzyme